MSLRILASAVALALSIGFDAVPAGAASSYDGVWMVDNPPSDLISGESEYVCSALRLRADVKDG